MTESFNRKAGEYVLNNFKIYKLDEPDTFIDISKLIHYFEISESMSTGYMQGHAMVYDSVGLIDEFLGEDRGWLKGEEEVEITHTDFFKQQITQKFFVYAISNLEIAKDSDDSTYRYKIHFVSKEKFYGDRALVRRSFSGAPISNFVQTIFNDYFNSEKDIYIEPTDGDQKLVVPNYTPTETMNFFSRKAISKEYDSNTFRFFESKDGFYFATLGWIVDDYEFGELDREGGVPIFIRSNLSDQSPEGQLRMMSTLISVDYPNYINTIEDMNRGAYYKLTTELDFLNRTPLYTEYRYLDEYQNYRFPGGARTSQSKHSKQFIDQHFNYPLETLVIKDYKNPEQRFFDPDYLRPSTFYSKAYNEKNVNLYHHQNEKINVTIYGRNELTVGDIIELKLKDVIQTTEDRGEDEKRSGRFLVESVRNVFFEDQFTQILEISRSGFYGRPEQANAYENGPQTESAYTESGGTSTPGASNVRRPGEETLSTGTPQISTDPTTAGLTSEEKATLNAIAARESGGDYAVLNGGSSFDTSQPHPNRIGPGGTSTAAGRYQFTYATWLDMNNGVNVPMTAENQDRAALKMIRQRYRAYGALDGFSTYDSYVAANGLDNRVLSHLGPTWEAWQYSDLRSDSIATYNDTLRRNS